MRERHGLLLVSLVALLPTFGIVTLPVDALALDGFCGGAILCDCGDQLTASRTLVAGVDPITTKTCETDGLIFFAAADLTLDLGGNTIRGSCPGENDIGIEVNRSTNITVRNGKIVGFDIGVEGNAATGTRVSDVQVLESCMTGVSFGLFGDNRLEKCIVRNTKGVPFGGDGIVLGGDNDAVHLCRAEGNAGHGIQSHGIGNAVTRNIVRDSGRDGVVIGGSAAKVTQNQSSYGDAEGFRVEGAGHVVSRNIAVGNTEDGFTVSATGSTFDRNRSNANGGFGILDTTTGGGTGGTANTYRNNVCTGNGLGDSSPPELCG
jgi:hypothetical protein